jgi:hypothetical protein
MQFHSVGRAAVGPSRAMTRRLQQAAQWMERALLAITAGDRGDGGRRHLAGGLDFALGGEVSTCPPASGDSK